MKLGILTFSYQGFSNFKTEFERTGSYSVNLGDNAQSIAAREILEELGEPPEDMIEIDRDTLPKYDGPPVILIMNGVFYNHSLPVPKNVFPIFVGFNTSAVAIKTHSESLRAHMPIGCRDQHTVDALVEVGIDAYVTGCITLAMKKRPKPEAEKRRLLIVTGAGAGNLPPSVLTRIPQELLNDAAFIHHRQIVFEFPLQATTQQSMEMLENRIIDRYIAEAELVLTPLHHVATPCMAQGVPIVLCREKPDARFSYLESQTPIYYSDTIDTIDWSPQAFDNLEYRGRMLKFISEGLERAKRAAAAG